MWVTQCRTDETNCRQKVWLLMRKVAEIYTVSRTTGQLFPMCSLSVYFKPTIGSQFNGKTLVSKTRDVSSILTVPVQWRGGIGRRIVRKNPVWDAYSKTSIGL